MTEADVQAMEADVLAVPLDPVVERQWAAEMIGTLRPQEQRLMAEWKLWKFLRDEARMGSAARELKNVRACLAYCEGLVKAEG